MEMKGRDVGLNLKVNVKEFYLILGKLNILWAKNQMLLTV